MPSRYDDLGDLFQQNRQAEDAAEESDCEYHSRRLVELVAAFTSVAACGWLLRYCLIGG